MDTSHSTKSADEPKLSIAVNRFGQEITHQNELLERFIQGLDRLLGVEPPTEGPVGEVEVEASVILDRLGRQLEVYSKQNSQFDLLLQRLETAF